MQPLAPDLHPEWYGPYSNTDFNWAIRAEFEVPNESPNERILLSLMADAPNAREYIFNGQTMVQVQRGNVSSLELRSNSPMACRVFALTEELVEAPELLLGSFHKLCANWYPVDYCDHTGTGDFDSTYTYTQTCWAAGRAYGLYWGGVAVRIDLRPQPSTGRKKYELLMNDVALPTELSFLAGTATDTVHEIEPGFGYADDFPPVFDTRSTLDSGQPTHTDLYAFVGHDEDDADHRWEKDNAPIIDPQLSINWFEFYRDPNMP